jgi:hypothetical protein
VGNFAVLSGDKCKSEGLKGTWVVLGKLLFPKELNNFLGTGRMPIPIHGGDDGISDCTILVSDNHLAAKNNLQFLRGHFSSMFLLLVGEVLAGLHLLLADSVAWDSYIALHVTANTFLTLPPTTNHSFLWPLKKNFFFLILCHVYSSAQKWSMPPTLLAIPGHENTFLHDRNKDACYFIVADSFRTGVC